MEITNSCGLRQVHQILTGLFISSSELGRLVDSLSFIVNPRQVKATKVESLPLDVQSLLVCAFSDSDKNLMEWCSYRHRGLMSGRCEAYVVSGLSSFPLAIWPFFGRNLNPVEHFARYLNDYHPEFDVLIISDETIRVRTNEEVIIISYNKKKMQFISALAVLDGKRELSFYSPGLGTVAMMARPIACRGDSPLSAKKTLSNQQYEGNVNCFELFLSSIDLEFSGTYFINKNGIHPDVSENILDEFVDSCRINVAPEDQASMMISLAESVA